MDVANVTTQTAGPARLAAQSGQPEGFASLFKGSAAAADRAEGSEQQQIRHAANQLVSSGLLKPLFDQMRSSPFKVERFHGGQGEKAFMQQMHTILADRISQSASFNVGEAIYQKMTRRLDGIATGSSQGTQVNTHG
jgi:hypothetical protein